MKKIFGHAESIMSYDTHQFKDYSRVVADLFDVHTKRKRREEVFPQDLQRAHDMGVRFATQR